MIKRAPIRNQRSKGIKVKHVLQICLLLGVCFWLIYQVKHSHDKKKEFDDRDTKVSVKARSGDEILTLGRKDLPQVREVAKNEKHEEEEEDVVKDEENKPEEDEKEVRKHEDDDHEDEEQEEANTLEQVQKEVGSKHEEEEQEEENKNEETEEEKRGSDNEEMDEQDQEKTEDEADREEEFIDEEKEREGDGDERESEVNEGERKENENLSDDNDHDVGDTSIHVAREEHYKADDASSAVSHDNQIVISQTEKTSSENSNENSERDISEGTKISNNTEEINGNQKNTGLKLGEADMDESGSTLNVTTAEEKDHGTRSSNPKDSSLINVTNISTKAEISNNSAGLSIEISGSQQNGNDTKSDSSQAQNATLIGATNLEAANQPTELEQPNNNNTISDGNQYDSNSTISIKTVSVDAAIGDSFDNSEPILSEKKISLNATPDGGFSSGSSTNETANATQNEKLNINYESGGTNESSDSTSTEGTVDGKSGNESGETTESLDSSSKNDIVDAAKKDFIDSSDSTVVQDDKESQIDLETLHDIKNTADGSKHAAAE